jgi:hypothetical protein
VYDLTTAPSVPAASALCRSRKNQSVNLSVQLPGQDSVSGDELALLRQSRFRISVNPPSN